MINFGRLVIRHVDEKGWIGIFRLPKAVSRFSHHVRFHRARALERHSVGM